eukprot:5653381-Amphidinium_carterae.1
MSYSIPDACPREVARGEEAATAASDVYLTLLGAGNFGNAASWTARVTEPTKCRNMRLRDPSCHRSQLEATEEHRSLKCN